MKEEKIFDGLTNIREDIIERAEGYEFRKKPIRESKKINPLWVTVAVVAACFLLIFVSPFVYMMTRRTGSSMPPGAEGPGNVQTGQNELPTKTPEISIATENVWIYYVEGGEILREQHFVKLQAADVFELWKEKNGIGGEVQLLHCEIRSNATTEQVGEAVMQKLGDYHAFYLTVSKNLEAYYGQKDEALLLSSLEQTMTGYSGMEYQEYHLILE